jgi:hypothetical protein
LYGILIPQQIKIATKFYLNFLEAFILIKIFKCRMKDKRDKLFKAFLAKNAGKNGILFCMEFSEIVLSDHETVKAFIGQWNFHPFFAG